MLDNKETTQNYFKGLTRKDYIERVCKMGLKIFLFVESRRSWAVRQLHYTVILTASRN